MDRKKIIGLLKREEGTKLDFKQKLELNLESGKKELAKDICAIANSRGGRGYIVVGVEDKTKAIIGIDKKDYFTEEQIQQIVSSRCDPPIPVSVEYIEVENKNIALITIYDSLQRPYQLKEHGSFLIRRGSTTDTMRKQEIIASFQENLSLNAETCPILNSSINFLNFELVDRYFKSKGIEVNEDNRVFLMESASIIYADKEYNNYKCTLGGLLVFCDMNSVYLPHNMIRICNKVNKLQSKEIIIQGNIIDMAIKCTKVLNKILPLNYPVEALSEGVKNSVLYRDYTDFESVIEITIDYNSITVSSPGELIPHSKDDKKVNYPKRNGWIYEKILTLDGNDVFTGAGKGFRKMKESFKNSQKVIFINSKVENRFKVIFPGVNYLKR